MEIKLETNGNSVCLQSPHGQPILQAMFEKPELSDVALFGIRAPGDEAAVLKPIKTYKGVLACVSKHLYDLFTVDGFIDSHQAEYTLEIVKHDALESVVRFVHVGSITIPSKDAVNRIRDILIAAKYLVMNHLADACEKYLVKNILVANWVDMLNFACNYKCLVLQAAVGDFVAEQIDIDDNNNAVSKEFLALSPEKCINLLTNTGFIAKASSDMQCRAALAWLKHDAENRKAVADELMDKILPLAAGKISNNVLIDFCDSEFVTQQTKDKLYKLLYHTVKDIVVAKPKERGCSGLESAVYILGGQSSGKSFWKYEVQRQIWTVLEDLPFEITDCRACIVGSRLVVMGGLIYRNYSADISEYDLKSNSWQPENYKLVKPRAGTAVCTDSSENIFLFGGITTCCKFNKYNLRTGIIQSMPDMKVDRFACTATYTNEAIFVVGGGFVSGQAKNRVDKFDLKTNTWSDKPLGLLQSERLCHAAALAGDSLFLVGGGTKKVEIINISTGQITTAPDLPSHDLRKGCGAAVLYDNVVCVFGGNETDKSVPCYDIREGKWSKGTIIPDMPKANGFFGFACV